MKKRPTTKKDAKAEGQSSNSGPGGATANDRAAKGKRRPEESMIKESRLRTVYAIFKRNQDHPNPAKRYPTIKELGAALDPDRPLGDNTVRRVLDAMRDDFGMPVDYVPERGGHGFTEPVAGFPLDAISEQQVYDLIQSVQMLGMLRDRKAYAEIRREVKRACLAITMALGLSFEEIEQSLSFHVIGFDGPAPVDPMLFKAAMRAILRRKEVRLEHRSVKRPGEVSVKVIEPLHLGMVNHALYLWHYDPQAAAAEAALLAESAGNNSNGAKGEGNGRGKAQANGAGIAKGVAVPGWDGNAARLKSGLKALGIRKYALTRVGNFEETGRTFDPARHGFDIREQLRHGMGAFDVADPVAVRLKFTAKMAPYILERRCHESQQIERLPDGGIVLKLEVAQTPELEAYVLRWAGNVEVLQPATLRARMKEIAAALLEAHRL